MGNAPGAPLLEAAGLRCVRGGKLLFQDVAVSLSAGEGLHVRGENGAGKTSFLRILVGLLEPDAGQVRWRGQNVKSGREEMHSEMTYVGHLNGIKDELTVLENLSSWAAVRGQPVAMRQALQALESVGMSHVLDAPVRRLSQGQRRRVSLARLFLPPRRTIWILDEPFNALDSRSEAALGEAVSGHLENGGIAILTAHQRVVLPAAIRAMELGREAVPC